MNKMMYIPLYKYDIPHSICYGGGGHVVNCSNGNTLRFKLGRSVTVPNVCDRCAYVYETDEYLCMTYCYINQNDHNVINFKSPGVYPIYSRFILRDNWPSMFACRVYTHLSGVQRFLKEICKYDQNIVNLPMLLMNISNDSGLEEVQQSVLSNERFVEMALSGDFSLDTNVLDDVLSYIYNDINTSCEEYDPAEAMFEITNQLTYEYESIYNLIYQFTQTNMDICGRGARQLSPIYQTPPDLIGFGNNDWMFFTEMMKLPASDIHFKYRHATSQYRVNVYYEGFTNTNLLQFNDPNILNYLISFIPQPEINNCVETDVVKTKDDIVRITWSSELETRTRTYDLMSMMLASPTFIDYNAMEWPRLPARK